MATKTYCTNCEAEHEASEAWCRAMCDEIRRNLKITPSKSKVAKAVLAAVGTANRPATGVLDTPKPVRPVVNSLSPKQDELLAKLASQLVEAGAQNRFAEKIATARAEGTLTKRTASQYIDALINDVRIAQTAQRRTQAAALPVVPEGTYAIDTTEGATNTVAFYRVWHGRNGYVGVNREIGPSDTRVPFAQVRGILERILAVGTEEALARYGRETGVCGHCHTRLTNDESRALGIGPICRAKRAA